MNERIVVNDTAALAVHERGTAAADRPTIVMTHGWPDSSLVWDLVADRLADRFHVVTYDARGVGKSTPAMVHKPYALTRLADDIDAVCRAVSPDRPVHLVGHDWGGVQGWDYVGDEARQPHVVSFTTVSGPCLDHVSHWARARLRRPTPRNLFQVGTQVTKSAYTMVISIPVLRTMMWRLGFAPIFRRWMKRAEGVPAEDAYPGPNVKQDAIAAVPIYRTNIGSRILRPNTRRAHVPVQLIVNTRDHYVSPRLYDDMDQWAPELTRRELPAGHWSPRTHPDELAQFIAEFVDAIEARRPIVPSAPELARSDAR